jgi:hypothetical protein
LITVDKCYYTGKVFEESTYSRSVDRVDSAKGYIDSNVVSCTIDINSKKSNLTNLEIESLYLKLKDWKV